MHVKVHPYEESILKSLSSFTCNRLHEMSVSEPTAIPNGNRMVICCLTVFTSELVTEDYFSRKNMVSENKGEERCEHYYLGRGEIHSHVYSPIPIDTHYDVHFLPEMRGLN